MPGKPDAASIFEDFTHLETMWNPAIANYRVIDDWYWQTARIWALPLGVDRPQIIPPTAANIVNHMTASLAAFDFVPHREAVRRGKVGEEQADEVEPWTSGVFLEASLQEPSLTWMQAGKNVIQYGRAVIEGPTWDTGGKPIEPEQNKGESDQEYRDRLAIYKNDRRDWFPIRIRAPHPARVLCDPGDKQPRLVVKKFKMYAYQLEDLTSIKMAQQEAGGPKEVNLYTRDKGRYDLVTVTEWWSEEWHALISDKKDSNNLPEFIEKNPYGFPPFVQFYSGQGGEPTHMEELDPQYLSQGFLGPVIPLLQAQAQRMSAELNAIILAGFPQPGSENPKQAAEAVAQGGWLPGSKDDYWYMDPAQWPNYLHVIGAGHDKMISESVPAFTLVGQRQEGVSTVGQQVILTTAAEQVLKPIRTQMDQAASITASRTLRMVDIIGEDITVNGKTVGREQIKHDYNIRMDSKLTDPILKLQQVQSALEAFKLGLLSKEDVWRIMGEEDATGIRVRMLKDKLYENDRALAEAMGVLARQEGMVKVAEEFEQVVRDLDAMGGMGAQNGQGSGLVGPNGQPFALPGSDGAAGEAQTSLNNMLTGDVSNPSTKQLTGR